MKSLTLNSIRHKLLGNVAHGTSPSEAIGLGALLSSIVLAYFPIFSIIHNGYNSLLAYPSDFAAIKFFALSLPMIIFIIAVIINIGVKNYFKNPVLLLLVLTIGFLVFQTIGLNGELEIVAGYHSLLITCVLLFGYSVYKSGYINKFGNIIAFTLLITASINGLIGIVQFLIQSSVGLTMFGESTLSPSMYGVAKVVHESNSYLRGYGLFPHPNILAFMLSPALLVGAYLLNNTYQFYTRIIISILNITIIFGLFVSFSRVGLFAALAGLLLLVLVLKGRTKFNVLLKRIWVVPVIIILSGVLTFPWWVDRAGFSDSSADQRTVLQSVGQKIALNNWFFGTGPGTNLFHMERETGDELEIWDVQPVHSYLYIIVGELGILGITIFIFSLSILYQNLRKSLSNLYQKGSNIEYIGIFGGLSLIMLIVMCFDHYLYTYLPTQLIFWMILGMAAAQQFGRSHHFEETEQK